MTDFYKKLYGYEDDIQLKDDDIKLLETGMNLRKMKANKEEFNQRFYRLDLNNYQLVASTREFRKKEKIYPLLRISEVKAGCCSDNLKYYKLKRNYSDRKKIEDMEDLAFVIVYENYKKSLDLIAPTETDRNRWVRVLSYFVVLTKKRKGVLPETDTIMRNYFELADTSSDRKIDESEVTAFLDSINIRMKKDQLKKLMKNYDSNNDGELDESEFEKFVKQLYERREIISLYKLINTEGEQSKINFLPETISLEKFKKFLEKYQKEFKTEQECKEIISKYELSDCKEQFQFSLCGFLNYLSDHNQHIHDPHKEETVYQNMNLPFNYYFINSSHNTYLSGDQIASTTGPESIIAAIMKGARLIELDTHDGSDGQPRIFHKKTLTNKILFEDVIVAVKDYAFKLTTYPLIITIELHCTPPQQKTMAFLIKKHLNEFLYTDKIDEENYPTLEDLKGKIIIRCQKPKKTQPSELGHILKQASSRTTMENIDEEDQEDELQAKNVSIFKNFEEVPELCDLVNCLQNASFKGIDYAFINYRQWHSSSLNEDKCQKLINTEKPQRMIEYTSQFVTKVYPAFYRQDSSNVNALLYWPYGFQIVALNFQTNDLSMQMNEALFADNGGCGYVLKPDILNKPNLRFDPRNRHLMSNKKILEIKVISGQHLPRAEDIVKDITDPYVTIQIFGVPDDVAEKKTKTLKNNGLNPIWNEDFKFTINCPELAFVKFTVKDDDIGKDQFLGYYTIRFENIRAGYRHLKLKNTKSKGTLFLGIKISPF